jgi:spoIIIJ-associated protein
MSERKASLEIIAPSVEEAIERGVAELGVSREALDIEILDEGSRGLLGIGARQARVRLTLLRPAPAAPESIDTERELESRPARPAIEEIGAEDAEALQFSRQAVLQLCEHMGLHPDVEAHWAEEAQEGKLRPLMVDIHGKDLSMLIGRRGETLRALQYITRLIVSKQMQQPVAVVIDVEGYRARRERQLRRMARQVARQTVERGKTMILEPMPASDRRIIHLELHDHPDVYTQSIGEGEQRKVTIIPRQR